MLKKKKKLSTFLIAHFPDGHNSPTATFYFAPEKKREKNWLGKKTHN